MRQLGLSEGLGGGSAHWFTGSRQSKLRGSRAGAICGITVVTLIYLYLFTSFCSEQTAVGCAGRGKAIPEQELSIDTYHATYP